MPSSKKKKSRGKARRAAKSRKAKEEDGAVNVVDSEMQRLQISNNKNSCKDDEDDEDALLEAAINLAASEKEEMEMEAATAKNDDSEECHHGYVILPMYHVCVAFVYSFYEESDAFSGLEMRIDHFFKHLYEATRVKYAEVWNDPDKLQLVASLYTKDGVGKILEEGCHAATIRATLVSFFEQWAAVVLYQNACDWDIFVASCDWAKMSELIIGDEHTLVSFFRKRITCTCLDNKYKEVKSIAKIGTCCNIKCSLPDNKAVRSEMLSCTQCRANYCSRECQAAHWPTHKETCAIRADIAAARKSRQKSR